MKKNYSLFFKFNLLILLALCQSNSFGSIQSLQNSAWPTFTTISTKIMENQTTRFSIGFLGLGLGGYILAGRKNNSTTETAIISEGNTPTDKDYFRIPGFGSTNITKNDMSAAVALSITLGSLGLLANEKLGKQLLMSAIRAPIVAAMYALVCSKPANGVISYLPFGIGENIACKSKTCTRPCQWCLIRKMITTFGLLKAIEPLVEGSGNFIANVFTSTPK